MDDAERAFRDALHRVDSVKIPVPSLEPAEVKRTPGLGLVLGRWLAAAAVVAVVAGLGTWALTVRGQPVTAVPAAPPTAAAPAKLTGTTWIAVEFHGKPTVFAPDKMPFLEFRTDSTFTGADPCNVIGGTYRLIGSEITITRSGVSTLIGCNPTQQQTFAKVLEDTRRVYRDGDSIELVDQPGNVLARFRSSEAYTTPGPTPTAVPTAAVEIRIRNASSVDFTDVYAVFPSGEKVHYGPLRAGSMSEYTPVKQAYSYTYLKVTTARESYVYQPIDYVGESALVSGRHYSYALDLVDSQVDLKLEFDE